MATFALNMGAQAYLIISRISGGYLDAVIRKAIAVADPISKKAAFDVIGLQRGAGRTGQLDLSLAHVSLLPTLLPGQDKPDPFEPMSSASCFVVSCGVRLSEVALAELRKPQAE